MPEPEEFARRLGRLGVRIREGAGAVMKKAALAVDASVVLATPVDTGRARANWLVTLDHPSEETVPPQPEGKGGSSGAQNAAAALGRAAREIAAFDVDRHRSIHVCNNLPYIGALNDGSSAQAPAGFVQQAARDGASAVRGARLLED